MGDNPFGVVVDVVIDAVVSAARQAQTLRRLEAADRHLGIFYTSSDPDVDDRVRALLERTETLARDQLRGLHGTMRGLRVPPDGETP
jgi:hypothetical protein